MPTVPIVPTEELQGGGFQPFSVGGEVAPMRDVAGRQAQEMGQSMVNAGQVLGSIANKMQDQMDDAATKQADVTFLTKAQDILWGEKGYLNTLGAGAADPSSVNAALIEAQKEVEKGLTNDVQRMMFGQSASRNMLNFSGKIAEHRFKQTTDYAAGESKSRADRYTMEAANNFDSIGMVDAKGNPTGPYNTAVNTALQEANAAADLMMLPPDSEQRKAMVRGVYGNVASGVVNNLMVDGRYLEAKSYIDSVVKQGQLDPADAMKLTSAIDTGYDRQRGMQIGEGIYSGNTVGGTAAESDYQTTITGIVPGAQVKVSGRRIPIVTGTQPGRQPLQMDGVQPKLINNWELVQGDFGRAVTVVSGSRDAATNAKAGGAKGSQHLSGNAIDVDVSNMSIEDRKRLISLASARGFTGIGIYQNSLHFDMRAGGPAMWGPSHHADSIPAWASGARETHAANAGKPAGGRDYHVPGATPDGFQTIEVQPIQGMQVNDFVKLLRTRGLEVAGIEAPEVQVGEEPVWTMAVKLPNELVGARDGGVKVAPGADGKKDLGAMEAAIKDMGLDPDQEAVALQDVRQRYTHDQALETEQYKSTFESATETAFARVGGWRDIDPVTWGNLKVEDRAKLMEQPRGDDPDTVIKLMNDPSLWEKGKIEEFRPLLSEATYQKFYGQANGPDGPNKVREATIDNDLFNATLNRNGLTSFTGAKDDSAEKQQLIEFKSKFKVLIDAEQTRLKRSLSMTEKQTILDGMLIDKAFIDNSTYNPFSSDFYGGDSSKPAPLMTEDELKRAYVVVGSDEIRIATISNGQRVSMISSLQRRGLPVTEQAIAELWVKAGKPK